MAISFDDDPLGAILEYGHLHKTKDAQGRQAWEKANIKGMVGQSPWLGYCIHEHQLVEALGAGGTHALVKPIIRRALIELRSKHLIEPSTQDANQATEWLEITALGSDLVQTDSHREYLHGMKYVVERWRYSVFMLYLWGVAFGGFCLLAGVVLMAASWRRTFPRGVGTETADLLRRLPLRFWLTAAGALLIP